MENEVAQIIDYTPYLEDITEMLSEISAKMDSLALNDAQFQEGLDMLGVDLNQILGINQFMQTFQEYMSGALIFIVVVLLLYFSYKFLRIFF